MKRYVVVIAVMAHLMVATAVPAFAAPRSGEFILLFSPSASRLADALNACGQKRSESRGTPLHRKVRRGGPNHERPGPIPQLTDLS